MPLPGEASFKRKGEYAPAANDDGIDETTPYKPIPLTFNQADATTIRNLENDRMTNDHDSTPLTFQRRRSPPLCANRRTCVIICIVGIIIFFTIVLPLALTYGRKSDSAGMADSGKLHGNISFVVSSNNNGSNSSFESFITTPVASTNHSNGRQVRKVSYFNADENSALQPLKDLIFEALTIYSPLCTMNKCKDATLSNFELDNNRINTGFNVQLSKGQMENIVADKSMLAELETTLKLLFPKAYPAYIIEHVETDVDVQTFCLTVVCLNNTEANSMRLVNNIPTNSQTIEEADWRSLEDDNSTLSLVPNETVSDSSTELSSTKLSSIKPSSTKATKISTLALSTRLTTNVTTSFPTTTTEITKLPLMLPHQTPSDNCANSEFDCLNIFQRIPINQRCDGVTQCKDGSDEINCTECRTSLSCPSSIGKRCLRGNIVCDKKNDCTDGTDESERYCRSECKPGEWKCTSLNKCIPVALLCDGDAHCPDNNDETVCTSTSNKIDTSCNKIRFIYCYIVVLCCTNNAKWCVADSRCIPSWSICDDKKDCPDGSDEAFCPCSKRSPIRP